MLDVLAQSAWPNLFFLKHVPLMVFVFCFGACVGSFLNVVIYRLPAGMSVVSPPSRCPICGARLKFFGENLPIIGWFVIRGKCRYCGVKISSQYMLIELLMALIFLSTYFLLYTFSPATPWNGQIGSAWWFVNELIHTWPVFIAMVFLLASLVAMTSIDARTFTIPLSIPVFVTVTAFIAYPLQALLPLRARVTPDWPIQALGWPGLAMVGGGMLGITISYVLLRLGRIRYSFCDYGEFLPESSQNMSLDASRTTAFEVLYFYPFLVGLLVSSLSRPVYGLVSGVAMALSVLLYGRFKGTMIGSEAEPTGEEVLAEDYPHVRREMGVEILYLSPCLLGMLGGWLLSGMLPVNPPPVFLQALGGTFAGYLMGGGLIWAIRIIASLIVGREAMGIGDVHLLAAVGAVLGWFDPILIFFIAPFSGLFWFVLSKGLAAVVRQRWSELPYGPHLAIATLVIILARPAVKDGWQFIFKDMVKWPSSSLVQPPPPGPAPGTDPGPQLLSGSRDGSKP